jgi:predicted lipid-binding transport protein (Tim44 family)
MMERRPGEEPGQPVQLSDEEIRALGASLRSTPRGGRAEQVAGSVTGAATGVVTRLLSWFRIPLALVAGVLAIALLGGLEGATLLGRLGGGIVAIIGAWIFIGRLVTWLEIRKFHSVR